MTTAAAHPVHTDCKSLQIWVAAYIDQMTGPGRDPMSGIVCYGPEYSMWENIGPTVITALEGGIPVEPPL